MPKIQLLRKNQNISPVQPVHGLKRKAIGHFVFWVHFTSAHKMESQFWHQLQVHFGTPLCHSVWLNVVNITSSICILHSRYILQWATDWWRSSGTVRRQVELPWSWIQHILHSLPTRTSSRWASCNPPQKQLVELLLHHFRVSRNTEWIPLY